MHNQYSSRPPYNVLAQLRQEIRDAVAATVAKMSVSQIGAETPAGAQAKVDTGKSELRAELTIVKAALTADIDALPSTFATQAQLSEVATGDPIAVTDVAVDAVLSDPESTASARLSSTFATQAQLSEVATGDPIAVSDVTVAAALDTADSASGQRVDARTVALLRSVDAYRVTRADVEGKDAAPVVKAAIEAAVADGIRRVILPPATMTWGSQVAIPANAHGLSVEGYGEATVIRYTGDGTGQGIFNAQGTDGAKVALTTDAPAGTSVVTVPDTFAVTLTVGDVIGLDCTAVAFGAGSMTSRASELRKVVAVSGTTVTVDGPLLWAYPVAAGARVWRQSPIRGLSLRDFVITSADPAVNRLRAVLIVRATDVTVHGVTVRNNGGGGIYLTDVLDSHLSAITIDGLPTTADYRGYGVTAGGRSAHMSIEGLSGRNFRHLFTTQPTTYDSADWGGPRHVMVRGGVGEGSQIAGYSVWDTHPYGYDITFDSCRAFGGKGADSNGFQIRSKKTTLLNCKSLRAGGRAVRTDPTMAADVEIIGGEFAYAAQEGIGLCADLRISGAWVHHNNLQGFTLGANAPRARITNNRIEDNGQTGSGYAIHDQTATGTNLGVVVQGNTIPKSATQTLAVLSPKGNFVYAGNVALGYGAGNDGVGGTPDATVKRANNVTD